MHCQLIFCQVPGCAAPLSHVGNYFTKRRVCREHSAAKQICIDGQLVRFCQQCARMQPLADFKSDRRSCRISLAALHQRREHRSKHAVVQPRSYASPSPTHSSSDSGSGPVHSVAWQAEQQDGKSLSDEQKQRQQGCQMLGLQTGIGQQQMQQGLLLDPQQQEELGMDPDQWLLPLHMPLLHEMLAFPLPDPEPGTSLDLGLEQTQVPQAQSLLRGSRVPQQTQLPQPQGPQQGPRTAQAYNPAPQTAQQQSAAAQPLPGSKADPLLGAAAAQVTAAEGIDRQGSLPALCGTKRCRPNNDTAALALRIAELVSPLDCVPVAGETVCAGCSQPIGLARLLSRSASSGGSYSEPGAAPGGCGAAMTAAAQHQALCGSAGQQRLRTCRTQQQLQQVQPQAAMSGAGQRASLLTGAGVTSPRAASTLDVCSRPGRRRSSSSSTKSPVVQLLTDILRNLPAEDMPLLHRVIHGQRQQQLGHNNTGLSAQLGARSAQLGPSMQTGYAEYGQPAAAAPETSSNTGDRPDDRQMMELPRFVSVFQAMPGDWLPLLQRALQYAQQNRLGTMQASTASTAAAGVLGAVQGSNCSPSTACQHSISALRPRPCQPPDADGRCTCCCVWQPGRVQAQAHGSGGGAAAAVFAPVGVEHEALNGCVLQALMQAAWQ